MEEEISDGAAVSEDDQAARHLQAAHEAYDAEDSVTMTDECKRVLELDPENPDAWDLLAKFGGWDSKFFRLDVQFAVDAAQHALGLIPESARADAASQIYDARKRQIAHMLDDGMLDFTTRGAKRIHGVMMDWLRLLTDIPYLTPDILEGEATLCENLCNRSRSGIMPADRMVYSAYKSLNGKETYGQTFRRVLGQRLEAERARQDVQREQAAAAGAEAVDAARAHLAAGAAPAQLREDRAALEAAIDAIVGLSPRDAYARQLAALDDQLARTLPLQMFKQSALKRRQREFQAALKRVDDSLARELSPLKEQITAIDQRLGEAGGSPVPDDADDGPAHADGESAAL